MISLPILSISSSGFLYPVDADVCDHQLGATLFQTQPNRKRKTLWFWPWTLRPTEKNYSVPGKESLAAVWALQTLHPFFQCEDFTVHSDHASLQWLMRITEPSGRPMQWNLRLREFSLDIADSKRNLNTQADTLSRLTILANTATLLVEKKPSYWTTTQYRWERKHS